MASKIQLTIGGLDYTTFIDLESVHVDNNVIMTSDSASLTMQLDGELSRPRAGQEFIWRTVDTVTGAEVTREFGGVVVQVSETTEGTSLIYSVTIKSYEHWFNRHLVVYWYNQDLASNIVKLIVQQFCPGFTTNNVQTTTGANIVPQYFNYSKPSDAIKAIADQLEWGFYIDYYKDVHFYPSSTLQSPLPSNLLDVDNDLTSYGDLTLVEDGQQVFNKVILRGFKTRSSNYMNLSYLGDGSTTQWSMGYRASSVKGDVKVAVYSSLANYNADVQFKATGVPDGTHGGAVMTMKKDIVDGAPDQAAASNTAYIHYTQHLLRLPNYNGAGVLPSGYCIGVFFYYMKDITYMGQDVQAQTTTAQIESTDGIYEYSEEDKSLTNSTIAAPQSKAQLLLLKYNLPQITGSFTSYLSGWKAGQSFTLTTQARMGGLTTTMFVLRVTKTLVNNINNQYVVQNVVEFADSPYLV